VDWWNGGSARDETGWDEGRLEALGVTSSNIGTCDSPELPGVCGFALLV